MSGILRQWPLSLHHKTAKLLYMALIFYILGILDLAHRKNLVQANEQSHKVCGEVYHPPKENISLPLLAFNVGKLYFLRCIIR